MQIDKMKEKKNTINCICLEKLYIKSINICGMGIAQWFQSSYYLILCKLDERQQILYWQIDEHIAGFTD